MAQNDEPIHPAVNPSGDAHESLKSGESDKSRNSGASHEPHDAHQANRRAWNEAAAAYRKALNESVAQLSAGKSFFVGPELRFVEPLARGAKRAIHLQCAAGSDTLALHNLGAREVIGVDISDEMIELAREKTARLGAPAQWFVSDILNTPSELDGTADLVYTGQGAINWMMDIEAWARVVARLIRPGGSFYLFEGHPLTYLFKMDAPTLTLDPDFVGYFARQTYASQSWPGTYVGKLKASEAEQAIKYERAWPVSEVINALISAGLTLKRFEEHPDCYWQEFPHLPEEERRKFPNTYSLLMIKPGEQSE